MLEFDFVEKGTFAKLNAQKRIIRFLIGIALIAYFIWQLSDPARLIGVEFPLSIGNWIGVAILFYFFSDVFNIGFDRRWGRWPQYVFLGLVGAAIVGDLIGYGTFWGPPAGWLVLLMKEVTAGTIGLAHILSGALATPG